MTDIYVKGWLTGMEHKKHKTEVHYRYIYVFLLLHFFVLRPMFRLVYFSISLKFCGLICAQSEMFLVDCICLEPIDKIAIFLATTLLFYIKKSLILQKLMPR